MSEPIVSDLVRLAQDISEVIETEDVAEVGAELQHLPGRRKRFEVRRDDKIYWVTVERGF